MKRTSRFDKRYLLLVSVPIAILASLFAISLLTAWSSQRKLDRGLRLVTGLDDATAADALAVWYDSHSSKAETLEWRKMETASMAVSYLSNHVFGEYRYQLNTLVPPGQPWPDEARNERLVALAKPVVDRLKATPMPDEPVWHPLFYESFANPFPIAEMPAPLMAVLWPEIRDAYYKGDTSRAISAIRLYLDLLGPKSNRSIEQPLFTSYELHMAIRNSLSDGIWSEAELVELQQLLTPEHDWQRIWERRVALDALIVSPWLQNPWRHERFAQISRVGNGTNGGLQDVNRSTWVPSDSLDVVMKYVDVKELDAEPGTAAFRDAANALFVSRLTNPYNIPPGGPAFWLDQWLKLPCMPSSHLDSNIGSNLSTEAQMLFSTAVDCRFTRTAIAVKQYQMKSDKWPESLVQLKKVGLPLPQTIGSYETPFYYEVGKDSQKVKLGKVPVTSHDQGKSLQYDLNSTVIEISLP
ncbi:hypothetical protein Q31b_19990 [Novipirellula aureliae]|uniref:Uncharacterized protein n=1 Tax=Novipirellula aureliae TaxID=2527966 RepID=A0A5C6E2L8_9BACT|nr:hypothetical protein [Novipirellula aureliae]TWU42965.1 hypothetical protein Q31b_19990 [Novipirellula aureliae]